MTSTTTVTRNYTLQLSFEDYNEIHDYSKYGSKNRIPSNTDAPIASLAEAVALTDAYYSADSSLSWIAYWISESVTTTTVEVDGKKTTTTVVTEDTEDAHVQYRSAADYEQYVAGPAREREAERVASGEAALDEAYAAEREANAVRREQGEPTVHEAEIAYLEFRGGHERTVENLRNAAVTEPQKSGFVSTVKSLFRV